MNPSEPHPLVADTPEAVSGKIINILDLNNQPEDFIHLLQPQEDEEETAEENQENTEEEEKENKEKADKTSENNIETVAETAPETNLSNEDAGSAPYPTEWNLEDAYSVIRTTYENYEGTAFFALPDGGMVKNLSSLSNEELIQESQMPPAFRIAVNDKPQVLIMHTHTTETYEPLVREHYDPTFNYRTTDNTKNVVAVGDAITQELEAAGICVIHSDAVHDYPSYNGAYERSAETVKAILQEYPSIKVVLDIHRDAICTDTTVSQPIITVDGKETAQVMIISGCDDGTMEMPNYLMNFRFACRLQSKMESKYPNLARPILFDYRKYNQDLTTGSLLIEVGSHGNTIEQAVNAGHLIGESLSEVLLELR